jgi:rubrerythrin
MNKTIKTEKNLIKTTFTEKVNVKKALALCGLANNEIKSLFWNKNEINKMDGSKWSFPSYMLGVRRYLKTVIENQGKITKQYKFGKLEGNGRLFVDGVGIQSLQNKIKNYICGEYYYDIDIKNAHPCILLYICDSFKIEAPNLKDYVKNRNQILSDNELSKVDILIAINTDKNKRKHENDFYNSFIKELDIIKKEILTKIKKLEIKTNNEKNPISSIINKYILRFEGEIIQDAIKFYKEHASVPMFDGLMVYKEVKDPKIKDLNKLFKKYKYIEFDIKSTDSDIQLVTKDFECEEYKKVKERFEKHHFITIKPYAYWKQNKNPDGSFSYNQIKESDFKNACLEYKYISTNRKGQMEALSIFSEWAGDVNKRKYECIDFIPFGKEDECPPHVYNTFEGFEANKIKTFNRVKTKNFDEMISNLCNEYNRADKPMTDYLMNYIAHIFQYPNKRTEKIIVLKGWTGTGKDTLYRTLQRLAGVKYIGITEDCDTLFGQFNNLLDSKLAIFLNEMEGADGIKYQERLKALASNISNKVNNKHDKVMEQNNYVRPFVFSNSDNCVNIQHHDRRMVVIKTGFELVSNIKAGKKKDRILKFWKTYYSNLENKDWVASLYHNLMERDLSDFNPKTPPETEDKKIMMEKNISPIYTFLKDIIDNKKFSNFYTKTVKGEKLHLIKFKDLKDKFTNYLTENDIKLDYKIKETTIKQKLLNMNNSFISEKRVNFKLPSGEIESGKYSAFVMSRTQQFLENFIFTDNEEEAIDFEEVEEGIDA